MAVLINFKICDNAKECGGIEVCPTGALSWDEEKETIKIDNAKCISCGACEKNCPIGAISVAHNDEEYLKIKEEIEKDSRTIKDLFVDRYGATPLSDFFMIKEEEMDTKIGNGIFLVECYKDESIQCLLKSIPIKDITSDMPKDAMYYKVAIGESTQKKYDIRELPSLLIFKNKTYLGKADGYYDETQKEKLYKKISEILNGDINSNVNMTDISINTYNNIVPKFIEYYDETDIEHKLEFREDIDYMIGLLNDNAVILDAGCSIGDYTKYILEKYNERNFEILGIDAATNMIVEAKKRVANAEFKVMDLRNMNFSNNYFDAIFCLATLIHVDDETCLKILDKFKRILKSNGILVINVMEQFDENKSVLVPEPFNQKYKNFYNRYTKDFFTKYFKNNNFEILNELNHYYDKDNQIVGGLRIVNEFTYVVRKKNENEK